MTAFSLCRSLGELSFAKMAAAISLLSSLEMAMIQESIEPNPKSLGRDGIVVSKCYVDVNSMLTVGLVLVLALIGEFVR